MNKDTYHWEYLSAARFLLACIVFSGHLSGAMYTGPLAILKAFGPFEAILGFLLISGFSIGRSITKHPEHFLLRRAQRIYPVYIIGMLLKCILLPQALTPEFIGMLLANLFFLNQVVMHSSFIVPSWTLALEVWLYLLAPFLVKLSYRVLLCLIYGSCLLYACYTLGKLFFHLPYYVGMAYGMSLFLLGFIWTAGFAFAIHPEKQNKCAYT